MSQFLFFLRNWIKAFLYPRPFAGIIYLPRFIQHMVKYRNLSEKRDIKLADMFPCLGDWTQYTPFDAHYFFQAAWLARRLAQSSPLRHVDIGSSVMTIGASSAIAPTIFLDFRPLSVMLPSLSPVAGDILDLPFFTASIESLSCLHVIEHIGLGRYGDPIDPRGDVKATIELQRVISPNGVLYLSVPIGRHRVCFNAHRVYFPENVVAMFSGLQLKDFSYVDDKGTLHEHKTVESVPVMDYGCGLFVFEKPGSSR